jgi:hypothetical protein
MKICLATLEKENDEMKHKLGDKRFKKPRAVPNDMVLNERGRMGNCNKFGLALSLRGFTPNCV